MRETDILYETKTHWVCKGRKAFEVYRNESTHSVRCAIIGFSLGLDRAIAECDKQTARAAQ